MSRIGKKPIAIPAGVTISVSGQNVVTVKGPKGTLVQEVNGDITLKQEDGVLTLTRPSDAKPHKAMHGLYRSLIYNMVTGVTDGFQKTLKLVGTGYRASVDGNKLTINVGFSHPVVLDAPENIQFETPDQATIVVRGINKQQVGNLAADIRAMRKPEPYLGKGIRYQDEHIRRKEGKAG
ncbi:MAG: 50S ribosomal protein L6 [Clostridiales bacterium]|nr:50S ribosomal protein L6 [Clostridiales bacterium]